MNVEGRPAVTTEPRQEAERIVFQVGSGRKQAQRFHESEDEFLRRRNALVDVLAAAIEVDSRHADCLFTGEGVDDPNLRDALSDLYMRLSALREDET